MDSVSAVDNLDFLNRGVEVEINLIFKLCIYVFKNNIVYIRAEVANGCVKKSELILNT